MDKDYGYVPIDILLDAYWNNKPLSSKYTSSNILVTHDESFSFLDDPFDDSLDD